MQAQLLQRDDYRLLVTQGPAASTRSGPILTDASYPDVLVARAFSHGEDLELTLYPGKSAGPQTIKVERLQRNRRYLVTGAIADAIVADANGAASFAVNLNGRSAVRLTPAG